MCAYFSPKVRQGVFQSPFCVVCVEVKEDPPDEEHEESGRIENKAELEDEERKEETNVEDGANDGTDEFGVETASGRKKCLILPLGVIWRASGTSRSLLVGIFNL